jgi:DNA integrity scanning protein DisA with diadenylate cyclase activity
MAKKRKDATNENVESRKLVAAAFDLARSLDISKLLVQADELRDIRFVGKLCEQERIVWLTRGGAELPLPKRSEDKVVTIPDVALTRMSQLKVGMLLAILNEYVELDESILCLSGVAGSERLDTMLIANPQRDFPWFRKYDVEETQHVVTTRELVRIIDVALRLAREGREGRQLGTIFVLGDTEQLSPYLRQLVLNPCEGHPQKNRNIHDDGFFETLREFAALDGAFVVNIRGIVESAGTYIDAPVGKAALRSGLGARHTAAAAITATTEVIAVVVSESSGTVTVFHEGKPILELEKTQTLTEPPGRKPKRAAQRRTKV